MTDLDERTVAQHALDAAEEQLQSLCASHAGTFVSVERRGRLMEEGIQNLLQKIADSAKEVEGTQAALEQDDDAENSLANLSEKHRVRRRTLLQHASLLELLELPSLMDACVRSNLYDEALSIAAFANTLQRRHKDANQVVNRVIAQIRSRQTDLRRHLLHRLKTNVTMPQCLEVVTALRRLNSIDLERQAEANLEKVHSAMELRLQVEFLEARDAWLDSVAPGKQEELLDSIERYRTRVFEIATQFNAIFRAQANASESSVYLLNMWTSRRIQTFLKLLKSRLADITDTAALRDSLEASIFFSTSMGRLGADFTAQLGPIFEPRMLELVVTSWTEGVQQLEEVLKVCREAGVAHPLISPSETISNTVTEIPLEEPQPPPRELMMYPPLARLVNAVLEGLNDLRRCLLPGIFSDLRKCLDQLISDVTVILQTNDRVVHTPGLRGQASALREAAANYREVFEKIVEPYLRGSLESSLYNNEGAIKHHTTLRANLKSPELDVVNESEPEATVDASNAVEAAEGTGEGWNEPLDDMDDLSVDDD